MNPETERNPVDLVTRARAGDEEAFGELMKLYHQRVYGVLFGMVRNSEDAKELAQQTWIKAWNKLETFKGESDFYTWVYRIATFTGLDFLRKRKRLQETELLDAVEPVRQVDAHLPPSVTSRPDHVAQKAEIREVFEASLARLSPEHRTALVLREVEGLSYDEIAKVMKCRKGTVMSRIFYARKSIQDDMKDLM